MSYTREDYDNDLKKQSIVRRTFDFLRTRKRSFCLTFRSGSGNAVLVDLAKFCRVGETPAVLGKDGKIDVNLSCVMIGRQEVWLRIQQHLNLTPEQLMQLYQGKSLGEPNEHD